MALVVEASGLTDVGRKRKGNEDSLFYDMEMGLYIVADGMGGHLAGEVASGVVVETMRDYMQRFGKGKDPVEIGGHDCSLSDEANHLLSSIHLANQTVHEMAEKKKAYSGMGSTVSAVLLANDSFIIANVGDSPMYLIHDGDLEEVSVPHTVIAEQTALDPEAASRLGEKFAHMLTRAMGIDQTVEPDICEIQAFADDIIIIASDGLTGLVNPGEIKEIVMAQKPDKAVKVLVDMANARGGNDNITVIVIKVKKVINAGGGLSGLFSRIWNFFN